MPEPVRYRYKGIQSGTIAMLWYRTEIPDAGMMLLGIGIYEEFHEFSSKGKFLDDRVLSRVGKYLGFWSFSYGLEFVRISHCPNSD